MSNSLLFLNEAFKKLKACEESGDVWYMLLNNGMNFVASNLIQIYQCQQADFMKMNNKIIEEIIERCLKQYKNYSQVSESKEIIDIIMAVKNNQDIFQILHTHRYSVANKKINCTTQFRFDHCPFG